ncbi:MAG: GAF domain-containing protein, partial [Chitinophagales bacterium]
MEGTRRQRGQKRRFIRRWQTAVLVLSFGATGAAALLGAPPWLILGLGGVLSVLGGGWHGWGGGVALATLLGVGGAAPRLTGHPSAATGLAWAFNWAVWLGLGLAAAWTRAGWERGNVDRRREYQALAEEHVQAHERFETTTARLREKNEALERKYAETSALLSAVGAIGSSTKAAEIYETIVDTAVKLVVCDSCVLAVHGEAGEAWPVVATRGSFGAWRKGDRVRYGEGVLGWVAKHGQPVVVDDLPHDGRFIATPSESWFRSMVAVPLTIDGRVAAVLG